VQVNLRLRLTQRFWILAPCVSGNPSVVGSHHDWSGIPSDWNGDAGLTAISVAARLESRSSLNSLQSC